MSNRATPSFPLAFVRPLHRGPKGCLHTFAAVAAPRHVPGISGLQTAHRTVRAVIVATGSLGGSSLTGGAKRAKSVPVTVLRVETNTEAKITVVAQKGAIGSYGAYCRFVCS